MSSKIFCLALNFISSLKSANDKATIFNGIKSAAENQIKSKSHFIFAGDAYWHEFALRPVLYEGMKQFRINSALISVLSSVRSYVITKKEVEDHCSGKFGDKNSIHDDLDLFFERVCLGEEQDEIVRTYFFPKLSEKETKLFEAKDKDFMATLSHAKCTKDISSKEIPLLARPSRSEADSAADSEADSEADSKADSEADCDQRIIEKLESKSKYIRGICLRRTFLLNQNNQNDPFFNVHQLIWWKKSASGPNDERSSDSFVKKPERKIRKLD